MDGLYPNKKFILFGGIVAVFIIMNFSFDFNVNSNPSKLYISNIKNVTTNITNLYEIENIRIQIKTSTIDQNSTNLPVKPSVFCIIKTHPDNIAINKTLTVLNVWGRKCDNYR